MDTQLTAHLATYHPPPLLKDRTWRAFKAHFEGFLDERGEADSLTGYLYIDIPEMGTSNDGKTATEKSARSKDDKDEFVDAPETPTHTLPNVSVVQHRVNHKKVLGWLRTALGDDLSTIAYSFKSAVKLWAHVSNMYGVDIQSLRYSIQRSLTDLHQKPTEEGHAYVIRALELQLKFITHGISFDKMNFCRDVCRGFNARYNAFKNLEIDAADRTEDLQVLLRRVKRWEADHADELKVPSPSVAMSMVKNGQRQTPRANRPFPYPCGLCVVDKHQTHKCPLLPKARELLKAHNAGLPVAPFVASNTMMSPYVLSVSSPSTSSEAHAPLSQWIIDSGSSAHITPHAHLLRNARQCDDSYKSADGQLHYMRRR
jgi:hypothetical protein